MSRAIYRVYVIELSSTVFSERSKFRVANPQFDGVQECLYVGMSSKSPQKRFAEHINGKISRKGHQLASRIVRDYGKYLRPSLYQHLQPMTRSEALKMEKELTLELRRKRYAVWSN